MAVMGPLLNRLGQSRGFDRMVGLIDEGVQSLTNFGGMVLLGRLLPKEEFGTYALVLSICYLFEALQRYALILPFIISCPTPEAAQEQGGRWYWLHLGIDLAVCVVLAIFCALSILFGAADWFKHAVGFAVVAAPAVLAYEYTRRYLYQTRHYWAILRMVFIYAGVYAALFLLAIVTTVTIWKAVLALLVAAGLAAIVPLSGTLRLRRVSVADVFATWYETRRFTGWQLLTFFANQAYDNAMNLILAALSGRLDIAAYSATRTLIRPVNVVVSGVDKIDKPRAGQALAKDGMAGLRRSIGNTRLTVLLLGLPYVFLIVLFAEGAMHLVYGDKYGGFINELYLWAAVATMVMLLQPLDTMLITLRKSRTQFLCMAAGACTALVVAGFGVPSHGAMGALVAICAGNFVRLALLLAAVASISKS